MFHFLVVLSLIASNAYDVTSVTLDASMLTLFGYNKESSYVFFYNSNVTDIDPNAFKGYSKVTTLGLPNNALAKIDLEWFKDMVNLTYLYISDNPLLTQVVNPKKIVFPLMQVLEIARCPLTSFDSNVINALPNLVSFTGNQPSPIKPNQLSPWKKLQTLIVSTGNQTSLTKEHFNGLNLLGGLSFKDSNIKTIEVHTLLALPNVSSIDFSNNVLTSFEYLQIPPKVTTLNLGGNKMNYFMLSRTMGVIKFLYLNNNMFRSFKSMDLTFLANLTFLTLSNNPHAYPNEIAGHMKPLVNLYAVEISNLSINSIDSNFFKLNTNLHTIYLSNNKISVLPFNTFSHLKELNFLYLSFNEISDLDNRTFVGLDNLYELNLGYNKLTKISPRTFYNLSSLSILDLSNNFISQIDRSAFAKCSRLETLYLQNNLLSRFSPRTFEMLSLFFLNISFNQIEELENETFAGTNSITIIDLSYNNISRISPGSFYGVSEIEYIYLFNNQLTKIESGTFAGQNQLYLLDFTNNKINTIEAGALNGYLGSFSLQNNNLTQLDNSTFVGVTSISKLYLSNNRISRIEPGTFNSVKISNIYLSNNQLAKIENGTFRYKNYNSFANIDLRNNTISTIESAAFTNLANLYDIRLDGNNLTRLENSTFTGSFSLNGIYLYNNPSLSTSNLQSLCPTNAMRCNVYFD